MKSLGRNRDGGLGSREGEYVRKVNLSALQLRLGQAQGVTKLLSQYLSTGADPNEIPIVGIVDAIDTLLRNVEEATDHLERLQLTPAAAPKAVQP